MFRQEFILLPVAEKVNILWEQGEVVSEKTYYDCNITLFLLDNFYVEVFLNRVSHEIVAAEVQEHPQILYEYVKDLDLCELQRLLQGRNK